GCGMFEHPEPSYPGRPRRPPVGRGSTATRRGGWRRAATFMVLPVAVVEAMFVRAGKWRLDEGGRFDPRPHAVLLWSRASRKAPSRLVGAFSVLWHYPVKSFAVIRLVAWNEPHGGSLAEMCRAIELLAGVAWDDAPPQPPAR